MRRRAMIAGWVVALATIAGCVAARRAGRDDPGPAEVKKRQELSESAQAAFDRDDLTEARALLGRLEVEDTRSAEVHQRLGRVLQRQGAIDAAAEEYRKALALDKDYVDALIGLGQALRRLGQRDAALKRFAEAIEIDPGKAEAHVSEAETFESLGRRPEALASYFRALAIDPAEPVASLRVATIQLERDQPEQALARLDGILDLAPENGEARLRRGQAQLALGHSTEAVADLQVASARLPDRPDVFYQLARALAAARQTDQALIAADSALKLNPAYADARALSDQLRETRGPGDGVVR